MSLVKTLAKVAVGVAIAKGLQSVTSRGASAGGHVSDDGLFRGRNSPGAQTGTGNTGLEGMMDSILGGKGKTSGGAGGLGGLLEQMAGKRTTTRRHAPGGTGLDSILGGLATGGGLGGLLGGLAGQLQQKTAKQPEGSFGDVLSSQFDTTPEAPLTPTADQEAVAALMLSAMIQAAKSDGTFDAGEQKKLIDKLGEVGPEERAFVQAEMAKPVDVRALAGQVPEGMEAQTYMMSVLGIELDTKEEAQYLHDLATELALDPATVNEIHDKLGVPRIYR